MNPYILLISLFLFQYSLQAQHNQIDKEKWHWGDQARQDTIAGYAQVVKAGRILYISGAVSPEVSPRGIESVYKALAASLESFGAGFRNVVKETLYTTDMEAMKAHNEVRKKFYGNGFPRPPGFRSNVYIWKTPNWKWNSSPICPSPSGLFGG